MKFLAPIILFLDKDPAASAQALTNYHLETGIKGASQTLLCTLFYLVGIRNRTIFSHYVSTDRWDDTKAKYFPNWPMKAMPRFSYYSSPEAKWCRKCADHYRLVSDYLGEMLDEHEFRTGGEHELRKLYEFLRITPMELGVRYGYKLPSLKDPSKVQLPWKSLPVKFRKKDIIEGYRSYYRSLIISPLDAFLGTKRDVPDFLADKMAATVGFLEGVGLPAADQ